MAPHGPSRDRHQSGVEILRVSEEQNAAAALVAAGRFNDRVQQVFNGAMELSEC
jgi:hypothetical protein